MRRDSRTLSLQFPRDLQAPAVAGLLTAMAYRPRAGLVAFEVVGRADRIMHLLSYPAHEHEAVVRSLRATLPDVRWQVVEDVPGVRLGAKVVSSDSGSLLDGSEGVSAGLLASLSQLRTGETVVVQWLVASRRQPPGPHAAPTLGRVLSADLLDLPRDPSARERARRKAKIAAPVLAVFGHIGATAKATGREQQLVDRVARALRRASGADAQLRSGRASGGVARAIRRRRPSTWERPLAVNARELSGLLGWPIDTPAISGLVTGLSRTLPPPRTGGDTVLAWSVGGDRRTAIRARVNDRLQHLHVIGPTGVGKSHLLTLLALQDMAAGRGVVVIDPKGDLCEDLLARLPAQRADDVILLDPGAPDGVVGFNPLIGDTPDVAVDQLVGVFHHLYRSSWGPRTADVLRASLTTLAHYSATRAPDAAMTLVDVPELLTDAGFRRMVLSQAQPNHDLAGYWQWYEALSSAERAQVIAPVLNKLRAITLRPSLRAVLAQSQGLSLPEVLAAGRILLVPLRRAVLGPEATRLLGSMLVAQLWQAIGVRSNLPRSQRHPTFVYLDEVQDLLHTPLDLGDALAQARGLGVGLTLAHQHLDQLDRSMRASLLANARSRLAFRLGSGDATRLAREFEPDLTAMDLRGLPAREMAMQLLVEGQRAIATGRAGPLPDVVPGQRRQVKRQSLAHYGRTHADVEAAITARRGSGPRAGPPGREPR